MEENMTRHRQQEYTVDAAWIFDVDGVITNLQEKRVTEPEILEHIAKKLELGKPVTFNTGRSISWVIDRVINPLLDKIQHKKFLENLFAVGEKGGTWLTFDKDGTMRQYKDDSISIPQSLREKVKKLIDTGYSESMFYDESKETMISTEMKDGFEVEEYRKLQEALNIKLNELIEQENLNQQLKVDPTTIATDIENERVGKGFAIERILKWLQQRKINPRQFIAFGDSRGDLEMGEKLYERNLPFTFVYVGIRETLEGKEYPFPITYTQNRFDKGTLGFLLDH